MLDQLGKAPDWRFVRLLIDSPDADPLPSDPILANGVTVGYVSSGGYGFRIDRTLALGYLRADTDPSAPLTVEVLGRVFRAEPVTRGFYDPGNERLRS